MTGTAGDIIPIVIVPVLALAFLLVMVYYANSHPQWANQPPTETGSAHTLEGSGPTQRLSSPRTVIAGQRLDTEANEVTPEQAQASETRKE
ncbi:MAG TPA: hypothetical protein VFV02_14045 [Acidimicrobiales bacterium]|nr:hypothetical protein [Acidimicrobiales bacterium]